MAVFLVGKSWAYSLHLERALKSRPAHSELLGKFWNYAIFKTDTVYISRGMVESTEPRNSHFFCPIISMDHLSQGFQDLPEDNILALGDQAILRKFAEVRSHCDVLLSESIDDPEVFGPLINNFHDKLYSLKDRPSSEILLYISGHGLEPGNISLIPDTIYAHPAREDLQITPVEEWYTSNNEQAYMIEFYQVCRNLCGASSSGFVGGELYAHQRGYIGILGILGLWHYYTMQCPNLTSHHLFIVADICFVGIWGETFKKIKDNSVLRVPFIKHPVSIQCATNEFETSRGGVFTPLWYYLNTAKDEELHSLHDQYKRNADTVVEDDKEEIQHPCFVSTSCDSPSCKVYKDANFFIYLNELVKLKMSIDKDDKCTLLQPYHIALEYVKQCIEKLHQAEVQTERNAKRGGPQLAKIEQRAAENIERINEMEIPSLHQLLFDGSLSRPHSLTKEYHPAAEDNLSNERKEKLKKILPACKDRDRVAAGIYVFQGGVGDMSLIVAPGEDVIIMVDGTRNTDCFKAAWNAKLKHLKKITCIVVTHHDLDHTFGIDLLLQRYRAEGSLTERNPALPDLSNTVIYMNTREDFHSRKRNFTHEKSISDSANILGITVKKVIVSPDSPRIIIENSNIAAHVLLPTQTLIDQCRDDKYIPMSGKTTKPVPGRGNTTAANVLSINLAVVWRGTHAYLFSGDAHLKDVTKAAEQFMNDKGIEEFEYVDVPHHGSWNSNGENVEDNMRGLACIPSKNYLLSSNGSTVTAKRKTVIDILKSPKCKKLHFLYEERQNDKWKVPTCDQCETGPSEKTWKCCITDEHGKHIGKDLNKKIDTKLKCSTYKFFPINNITCFV